MWRDAPASLQAPAPYVVAVLAFTVLAIILSYWPIHNLLSRRQMMNQSFNRLEAFLG